MMELTTTPSTSLRKLAGVAAVIALHGALIYALVSGLAVKTIATLQAPIMATLIPEVKPPAPPEIKHEPPKPPPREQPPERHVYLPVPEIKAASPAPDVAAVVNAPTPLAPVQPPAPPVRTAATVDASQNCQAPEYPDRSRDAEEEGTVTLRLLIDVDGHVSSSAIGVSSGHARLDEAARDALSRCLFRPGTVDGKPQQSWATLKYVWKLQ